MSDKVLSADISVAYQEFTLELNTTFMTAGTTAVFGPSGSGKSTLLKALAGFIRPARGHIQFGDDEWFNSDNRTHLLAHKRPVGFLFQDARLFPHLSVQQNLLYAEKRSPSPDRSYTMDNVVEAFDLDPLLNRPPKFLSGGETQRVALARTLLSRPQLLLLDEPLTGLDRQRKAEILPYIDDLPRRFGTPVIYVSHDIDEIARVADQALILENGRLKAQGPAIPTFNAHGFDIDKPGAIVEGRVSTHDQRMKLTTVERGQAQIRMSMNERLEIGQSIRLRIQSRDIVIATTPPTDLSIQNTLSARITRIQMEPDSGFAIIHLLTGFGDLRARVTIAAVETLELTEEQRVYALIKAVTFET